MTGTVVAKQSRKGNREKLLNATLSLILEDQSGLAGLSLRKITKQSELSPPAFYNHFSSTEELGLALVEEAGTVIRGLLKSVRDADSVEEVIGRSVEIAFDYITTHRALFIFIARERAGSSAAIRQAIRLNVRAIIEDMSDDFATSGLFPQYDLDELRAMVSAIVSLGLNLIPDLLDLTEAEPEEPDYLLREFEFQVRTMLKNGYKAEPIS